MSSRTAPPGSVEKALWCKARMTGDTWEASEHTRHAENNAIASWTEVRYARAQKMKANGEFDSLHGPRKGLAGMWNGT